MNNKIEQFKKRNQKRNAHLYSPEMIEGIDYILCPVSRERLSMIKRSYVERVLCMNMQDYDNLYPTLQKVAKRRSENIKIGLKEVDLATGLTKYELSQTKARAILSQVDSTGKSGYKKKGEKTRATHMKNVDALGRNGYSQLASKAIIKGNATKAKQGLILSPIDRTEFYRYKAIVMYLTTKLKPIITEGFVTGLAGEKGAFHIDHKYSIMHGYVNKVSPLVIGSIQNLKMIPWEENLSKHTKSSIEKDRLLRDVNYSNDQSEFEFFKVMEFITDDIKNKVPVSGIRILEKLHEATLHQKH